MTKQSLKWSEAIYARWSRSWVNRWNGRKTCRLRRRASRRSITGKGDRMQTEPVIQIAHDGEITISTADSRKATQWRKRDILWSQLVERLRKPIRTSETFAEYEKMPKQ